VLLSPNSRFIVSALPYELDGYTIVDLVEKHSGAPWISEKEEPIDLVVCKKPRLLPSDDQVHSAGALNVTGLLGAALCGLCLVLARPVNEGLVRACVSACIFSRACVCVCLRACVRARV
jgi:hypothetical protein